MVRYRTAMADARADTAEGQNSVSRALKPCVLLSAAAFGATWQVGEWLRGVVLTGFPWLSSGYAQVDGPFAGLAPFIGVYGAGFATAVAGALITLGVLALYRRQTIEAMLSVVALVVLCGVSAVAGAQRFVVPADAPLTVRLLQGNIPQDIKFEQSGLDHSIDLYQHLITEKPADLIVTPETALPILINDTPRAFAETVRAFADSTGTAILLGAAGTVEQDGHLAYTNSTFGVTPGQNQLYRYDKHHLVPFGEFIPWGFHWFVDLMRMPLGDFARGPVVQTPFVVKGERFSVDICYEDIFGDDIAESLRGQAQPASVLVNSTNLGWFGDSIALDQHLQIARMRALETQRPILRATNTGTTAIIDSDGTVQGRLPVFTVGSLDGTVQGTRGLTPYVRFGDAPLLTVSLVLIAFALLRNRKRR
jgi:apolipoprotein N-acyltransferase